MDYKILQFNETTGQVTVQFADFQSISIDLPIDENNKTLSGDDLNSYIIGFAPFSLFERKQKLALGGITNAAEVRTLVQETPVLEPTPLTNEQKWDAVRAYRDQLLSACDWTQLEDAPLSADKKQEWETYRVVLRNVPQTYTDPDLVVYPTQPL